MREITEPTTQAQLLNVSLESCETCKQWTRDPEPELGSPNRNDGLTHAEGNPVESGVGQRRGKQGWRLTKH